ncbi:MAG: hypothetical protein ABIM30_05960 [candidate division WOR-3 bacterium]
MPKDLKLKIFGGSRFQEVEKEVNDWLEQTRPFIVKTLFEVSKIHKGDGGYTFFFYLLIFYNPDEAIEEIMRKE